MLHKNLGSKTAHREKGLFTNVANILKSTKRNNTESFTNKQYIDYLIMQFLIFNSFFVIGKQILSETGNRRKLLSQLRGREIVGQHTLSSITNEYFSQGLGSIVESNPRRSVIISLI